MEHIQPKQSEDGQAELESRFKLGRPHLPRLDVGIFGLVVTLVGMGVFFSIASPYFLSAENFLNIGRSVSIRGIAAAGLTMVMISGGLDLSIAAVMAAAGMLTASLVQAGVPMWVAVLAAIASGAAMGSVNGFFITKVRINPIIATLGAMSIMRGAGYIFSGGISISIPTDAFKFLGRGYLFGIPVPLILWVLVCVIVFFILRFMRFGQYTYAIGGNADACRVSGVRVDFWRFLLYVCSGTLAAFAGVVLTSLSATATPTAAIGAELDIIAAVILGGVSLSGGQGGVVGTVLGMLILGTMGNGLTLMNMKPYWQIVMRGVILMIAVTVDSLRTGGYR
jgi:ribose transport system permease protein